MVKVSDGPIQLTSWLVNVGTTVIVAVTGEVPVLTATNASISPSPEAAKPIPGVSFVHA